MFERQVKVAFIPAVLTIAFASLIGVAFTIRRTGLPAAKTDVPPAERWLRP